MYGKKWKPLFYFLVRNQKSCRTKIAFLTAELLAKLLILICRSLIEKVKLNARTNLLLLIKINTICKIIAKNEQI